MVKPSSARPYDPAPAPAPSDTGVGHRAPRRAVPGRRRGLRVGAAVLVLAAAAAYPVYRFVLRDDADPKPDAQVGTCLAAFDGFMGSAPRPATVDCGAPAARWRITAVFGTDHGAVPCRSLAPDKGYEAGLEWRDAQGGFVCLTVTPYTTYDDYGDAGTVPYEFNEADFARLKSRLLAATGQPAGQSAGQPAGQGSGQTAG